MDAELPTFCQIANYPHQKHHSKLNKRQTCTMCGKERPVGKKQTKDASAVIPKQNKGICTSCDVKVWALVNSGLQVKWCKGCKNFCAWVAFGDKGSGCKCTACRKRMAVQYATQKGNKKAKKTASASPPKYESGECKFKFG